MTSPLPTIYTSTIISMMRMLENDSGVWQEGPALQTVDTEVGGGGERRVVKSFAPLSSAFVEVSIKP